MAFGFSEAQWSSLSEAIARVGGQATWGVKTQLEADITNLFCRGNNDAEIVAALQRVSKSAHVLNDALRDLAHACLAHEQRQAEPSAEVIANDVEARLAFAQEVLAFAEGTDFTLDKGYRAFGGTRRGRPNDTTTIAWATALLKLAQREGWATEDGRGRTSAEITELLFELSECARAAGATHGRERRSLTRALAQARSELLEEAAAIRAFGPELDALGASEP